MKAKQGRLQGKKQNNTNIYLFSVEGGEGGIIKRKSEAKAFRGVCWCGLRQPKNCLSFFMVQRIMGEQLPLFLVKHLKFLSFLAEFE